MFSNLSLLTNRSLRNPLLVLSRSYTSNSRANSAVKAAEKALAGKSSKPEPHVQAAPNVANDLGGEFHVRDQTLLDGIKSELRVLKEDIIDEDVRRVVSKAKETSENLSRKLGSATGNVTGKIVGAVKTASASAVGSMQDLEAKGKMSLNDLLDNEEDKFGSFREPRPKQPANPKIDVLGEEDMNDLIDELEDKVRGMDHVKEAMSNPKVRESLGIDTFKNPGKRV